MSRHPDPIGQAELARTALHDLVTDAHQLDGSQDAYEVLASLSAAIASLRQVLQALADQHRRHADRTVDGTGDRAAGKRGAETVAADLVGSARATGEALERLDRAWTGAGHLLWPAPDPQPPIVGPSAPAWQSPARPPQGRSVDGGLGR